MYPVQLLFMVTKSTDWGLTALSAQNDFFVDICVPIVSKQQAEGRYSVEQKSSKYLITVYNVFINNTATETFRIETFRGQRQALNFHYHTRISGLQQAWQ